MTAVNDRLARNWMRVGARFLPFADAGTADAPISRLLRLSLFQVTVGMAIVLIIGTLNRVMIVELGVPATLVAGMVSLPLFFAPLRAVVGHRSDNHRSMLGWRRVPYLWMGTLLQFGGFAIMPFALILLSGDSDAPAWVGQIAAALAFLMVGAGMHTTQTVGLALATDLTPVEKHPQVVALLCVMLLVGMVVTALLFGALLADFSQLRLIRVVQGAAIATMAINIVALWKQEARDPSRTSASRKMPTFRESWEEFSRSRVASRGLVAVALGTFGFSLQDILLEPYGGQILHLSVGQTTALTAAMACGGLFGFVLAARWLGAGSDPYRVAGVGALVGLVAFTCVIFSAPVVSPALFASGVVLIGFGGGVFAHATLTAAMGAAGNERVGFVLGIWGAVQAIAAGSAIALGGMIRDGVSHLALKGALGPALVSEATGYIFVYHAEIALLFLTLVAIGPLVRMNYVSRARTAHGSNLVEMRQ
jgi:BCD family chlorophyll transporter-like MFS transporter